MKDFINLKYLMMQRQIQMEHCCQKNSQYQNITNARLSGIELQAQYQTERLTLFTNYGSTKGKDKDSGEALSNIAASKIGVRGKLCFSKRQIHCGNDSNPLRCSTPSALKIMVLPTQVIY